MLCLKASHEGNKWTPEGSRKAIDYCRQVIDLDPGYALAHARLAFWYGQLGWAGFGSGQEAYPRARAAALKALEIDPKSAEGHCALAKSLFFYYWRFEEAGEQFTRSLELNPRLAEAHYWYGFWLSSMGRHAESMREMELACELDPLSTPNRQGLGWVCFLAKQFDRAIAECRSALELDPHFVGALAVLGTMLATQGAHAEGLAELEKGLRFSGNSPWIRALAAGTHAKAGNRMEAQKQITEAEREAGRHYWAAYMIAVAWMMIGERGRALEWLEKAYEDRVTFLVWIRVNPAFSRLRDDPRFQDLVRRIGLPP